MRTMLIVGTIAILACVTGCKPLGELVFFFLLGCSLWAVADFVHDASDGYGFSARGQTLREIARHPDETVRAFECWRAQRDAKRAARATRYGNKL